ncbi:carbon catabolite repressor protein [Chloropicon primus]|uniref:Carbon catabolite repressor protein n=1 Tax=Chloropicon primus TaxID=1764295 RepID=A0A5B8MN99_9CHLO|nr:carbon catabolite repressor protein [Chloropicon primus]UPR01346.1 carbon catabolite repressor protein [Chloropicon primus]|mmetsp:Transcript_9564/g.27299  ORF Transcript_9564/g.27299 Transcript_9564/m.27299 type:complete len:392 (-) Transcript_9564:79-1254(-)|eukprot:QDZ22128.1 carbon catabolite repressor protein [Chloropicon primus]
MDESRRKWRVVGSYKELVAKALARAKKGRGRQPTRIRVMSYNILADRLACEHYRELYLGIPKWIMSWEQRLRGIVREVKLTKPDVVCFQEVEGFEALRREMGVLGFHGDFVPRTGLPEGCATFWRAGAFRKRACRPIEFAQYDLKQNVALCHVLEATGEGDGRVLALGNIHVLFNPKRGDIKLAQARVLMDTLGGIAEAEGVGQDIVICGDFNSAPESPVYTFVASGELDCLSHDRRYLSGQVQGIPGSGSGSSGAASQPNCFRLPEEEVEDHQFVRKNKKRNQGNPNKWSAENLRVATGREDERIATHQLKLSSAYKIVNGAEPEYTSAHRRFLGTVDYIWCAEESSLLPLSALLPVSYNVLANGRSGGLLPSSFWPSDHMSLCTDFLWT